MFLKLLLKIVLVVVALGIIIFVILPIALVILAVIATLLLGFNATPENADQQSLATVSALCSQQAAIEGTGTKSSCVTDYQGEQRRVTSNGKIYCCGGTYPNCSASPC